MKNYFLIVFLCIVCSGKAQVSDFNHIDFTRADNIAKLNEGENLKSLGLLSHKLTSKLDTDVEKFRAIYFWVCNNIKGDFNQHRKVYRNRKKYKNDSIAHAKWQREYKKIAFKKLLETNKTMCTGYAYLIKELSKIAGIECKIIDGYGRSVEANVDTLEMVNHSWNTVKLNNKWYLCDATWSSGYSDEYGMFIKEYNNGYFLTDPTLFAKSHLPVHKKWLLTANTTHQDFVTAPIIYGEAYKHKIVTYTPSTMRVVTKRKAPVNFEFKSLKDISKNRISLVFLNGNKYQNLKIYDVKNKNGSINFKYNFSSRGYYDVHLKVDNEIVASYTIKVVN